MGHRKDPIELIQTQGAADFAFLVSEERFAGPELTADGISYRRGGRRFTSSTGSGLLKTYRAMHKRYAPRARASPWRLKLYGD